MPNEPLPIFISYASYDNRATNPEEKWLDRLLQFLKPLELGSQISLWADTKLSAGSNWRSEIQKAIDQAKVAVLLVSPAFLASEFIRTKELPRLLAQANPVDDEGDPQDETAEGMLIIPVLLRPCLIGQPTFDVLVGPSETHTVRLTDFQYIPKGSAMNGLSQYEQDKQLDLIAHSIIDALGKDSDPMLGIAGAQNLDELEALLESFLINHKRWWFNALRIGKWGAKRAGFEAFGQYSIKQIAESLSKLDSVHRIQSKPGKKGLVYKSL